jgi:ketosteroid isomerase-like protein
LPVVGIHHASKIIRVVSAENVEIVRRSIEAYLAGDNAAALEAYDPAVVFDATVRPEGQIYHGRAGVAEAMRVWTGAWEDFRIEPIEFIDAGDRVLFIERESGRGKGSGVEIDQIGYILFTLRDGLIVHWKGMLDRDEAFAAAGLTGGDTA